MAVTYIAPAAMHIFGVFYAKGAVVDVSTWPDRAITEALDRGWITPSGGTSGAGLGSAAPAALGTAAAGSSANASHEDHVHPPTGLAPAAHSHAETDVIGLATDLVAKKLANTVSTVAYGATVTPVVTAGSDLILNIGALTGALTLANPTGSPNDGDKLYVRFSQDGTGGRVITYGNAFAFGTDVPASLDPTTANAKWTRLFMWNAADSKWRALAIARGF